MATGANVRRLNVPGCELEGIHYLRTFANSDELREDAAGKRVVLVGGSYIGSEVAASLTELGSNAAILEPGTACDEHGLRPAGRTVLPDAARGARRTVHGIRGARRFEGAGDRVTRGLATKSGLTLEADVVVMGTGAVPDVMLARSAGLTLGERGGVWTDSRLHTSAPGIYAAGDIAEYESVVNGGRRIRVEHWDVAFSHGKTAALNMLGRDQPHDVVPYFFSDMSDWASLEYVGPAFDWDQEIVRGSIDGGELRIWYLDMGRVSAALSVGRSDDLAHAPRLISAVTDVGARIGELADVGVNLSDVV